MIQAHSLKSFNLEEWRKKSNISHASEPKTVNALKTTQVRLGSQQKSASESNQVRKVNPLLIVRPPGAIKSEISESDPTKTKPS